MTPSPKSATPDLGIDRRRLRRCRRGWLPAWPRLLTSIQTHKSEEVQYPLKVVQIAPERARPSRLGQEFPARVR